MRGVGVTSALADALPPALVPVLELLTQLGDAWFVMVAVAAVYWVGPRYDLLTARDAARYAAVGLAAFGAIVALKGVFALPRPPAGVALVHADGHGFPSGHATAAAALYGGAAALFARPARRARWLLAGGLVAVVSATRLLLGVHYLVDVLAGALVGALVVACVLALTRHRQSLGFLAAAALGVCALAAAGPTVDALASVGITLGALCGYAVVTRYGREHVSTPLALCGLLVFGGFGIAALKAPLPGYGVVITSMVAGAGVLALPATRSLRQNFSR